MAPHGHQVAQAPTTGSSSIRLSGRPPRLEVYRIGVVADVGGTQQGSVESFGVGVVNVPVVAVRPSRPLGGQTLANRDSGRACGAASLRSARYPSREGLALREQKRTGDRCTESP